MRAQVWAVAATAVALAAGLAAAEDAVGVAGSEVRYPTAAEATVGGKAVRLVLTGAALRKRIGIKAYTVASYVQDGVPVRTAEQLIESAAVKMLHLVMQRDVDGPTMAAGVRTGIRLNYPADAFAAELDKFERAMKDQELAKGQHVLLTAVPAVGLHCRVPGKADVTIPNPAFTKAVWEIYLGPKNVGEAVKAGLLSRCPAPLRETP
jgi:hypothetical protein